MKKSSEEILTVSEAAKYLKLTDNTIRRLLTKKELHGKKIGSVWRIPKSKIEKYLESK